jgi:hypothetical protein
VKSEFSIIQGILITSLACFCSCKEREIYPVIPSIEYKSHYFIRDPNSGGFGNDTLIGLVFKYRDGDGDIGLSESDTLPPYDPQPDNFNEPTNPNYYNIQVDYLEFKDGKFSPFIIPNTTDTFKIRARIGSLTPDGKFKAIRGEIDYRFLPPLYIERKDTIKLRVKVLDRALNASNVVESPVIVLP